MSDDFYIGHSTQQVTFSATIEFHSFSYTHKKLQHNYMEQMEEMWAVVWAFHLGVSIHDHPVMVTWELRRHVAQWTLDSGEVFPLCTMVWTGTTFEYHKCPILWRVIHLIEVTSRRLTPQELLDLPDTFRPAYHELKVTAAETWPPLLPLTPARQPVVSLERLSPKHIPAAQGGTVPASCCYGCCWQYDHGQMESSVTS